MLLRQVASRSTGSRWVWTKLTCPLRSRPARHLAFRVQDRFVANACFTIGPLLGLPLHALVDERLIRRTPKGSARHRQCKMRSVSTFVGEAHAHSSPPVRIARSDAIGAKASTRPDFPPILENASSVRHAGRPESPRPFRNDASPIPQRMCRLVQRLLPGSFPHSSATMVPGPFVVDRGGRNPKRPG